MLKSLTFIQACPRHMRTIAALLLLVTSGAEATDQCQPMRGIEQGTTIQFLSSEQTLKSRIEATLATDLRFTVPAARFGIAVGSPPVALQQPVQIDGQILGRVLEGDIGELRFDQDEGTASLRANDRRFIVRVVGGNALDARGRPLKLHPLLTRALSFEVASGAMVHADGNSVLVSRGARLIWRASPNQPLEALLDESVRLEESTLDPGPAAITIKPRSVVAGGLLAVTVEAPDVVDLRARAPALCFRALVHPDRETPYLRVVPAQEIRLISQSGDKQTYSMRFPLPKTEAMSLTSGSAWWQRILGLGIELRVLAYQQQTIVLDMVVPLRLTSYRWTVGASFGVLFALYAVTAILVQRANPLSIGAALILHRSGRFSLSSLQILLWTLLVIFALSFAWISTGELVDLPNGVLALLGISAGSSVLAKAVESLSPTSTSPPMQSPRPRDLVMSEDGKDFDLLRFQMLAFTLFSLLYSLIAVLRSEGLPDIPETLYLLMGVSNTAYVAGKLPAAMTGDGNKTDLKSAPNDYERSLTADDIRAMQKRLGVTVNGQIDAATRDGIVGFKRDQGIYPASGQVSERLFLKIKQVKGE